ncbi:MAG TPA: hypothetical protein VL403_15635 [Candidatus Kryptonia bacterium]|nr:hypothetical protein [Candidatus Kryptonia bacterium]
MRVIPVAIGIALLLASSGCSGGDTPSDEPFKPAQVAAAQTPAFRNLGKRGDSKL